MTKIKNNTKQTFKINGVMKSSIPDSPDSGFGILKPNDTVDISEWDYIEINSETSHNNDFKKPCHKCDGQGEVRKAVPDIDGYDLEECHECNGQGFIKS